MIMDKLPLIRDVHFEQSAERLKIVLPVRRVWPLVVVYTALVVAWLAMMVWGVVYTVQIAFSGERYAFVFTLMLLILLYIFWRFGNFLRRQWYYYISPREILFINKERLILRRPVSILGNTDAYDMQHVSPFYPSEKPIALAFNYGSQHVYFAEALTTDARKSLGRLLNGRFFPGQAEDEDEDEE